MTPFEHLSVLISIILGVSIAQLLTSIHRLVQIRERVSTHLLTVIWTIMIFLGIVEWWWASFDFREQFQWNFFYFLYVLMSPVALYLADAFVLPDVESGESYDLKAYYYRNRGWFFTFMAVAPVLDAVRRLIQGVPFIDIGVWSNLVAAVLVGSLAVVRNKTYHWVITLLVMGLFMTFIVRSVLELGG